MPIFNNDNILSEDNDLICSDDDEHIKSLSSDIKIIQKLHRIPLEDDDENNYLMSTDEDTFIISSDDEDTFINSSDDEDDKDVIKVLYEPPSHAKTAIEQSDRAFLGFILVICVLGTILFSPIINY
jgi:hypothetical protein